MSSVKRLCFVTPLLLFVLAFPGTGQAQSLSPAVYAGVGTGTNLGGLQGIGTEVGIGDYVSASAAVGIWIDAATEPNLDGSPFGFDVGLKVYPFRTWGFLGLNYGLVDASFSGAEEEPKSLDRINALSFTVGARTPAWHNLYASGYLGLTSSAEANQLRVLDDGDFFPRIGLLVGYRLPFGRP